MQANRNQSERKEAKAGESDASVSAMNESRKYFGLCSMRAKHLQVRRFAGPRLHTQLAVCLVLAMNEMCIMQANRLNTFVSSTVYSACYASRAVRAVYEPSGLLDKVKCELHCTQASQVHRTLSYSCFLSPLPAMPCPASQPVCVPEPHSLSIPSSPLLFPLPAMT